MRFFNKNYNILKVITILRKIIIINYKINII